MAMFMFWRDKNLNLSWSWTLDNVCIKWNLLRDILHPEGIMGGTQARTRSNHGSLHYVSNDHCINLSSKSPSHPFPKSQPLCLPRPPRSHKQPTAHGLMLPSRCRRRNWRRRVPTWTRHRSPSGRRAPKMQNTTRKTFASLKKACIPHTSLSLSGTRQWHR